MTATVTGCPDWCVTPAEYHAAETAPVHVGRTLDTPYAVVEPQWSNHPAAKDRTGIYLNITDPNSELTYGQAVQVAVALLEALGTIDPRPGTMTVATAALDALQTGHKANVNPWASAYGNPRGHQ